MKTQQPDTEVVASLLNLRDELITKQENCPVTRQILFKINSCLYSGYPKKTSEDKG